VGDREAAMLVIEGRGGADCVLQWERGVWGFCSPLTRSWRVGCLRTWRPVGYGARFYDDKRLLKRDEQFVIDLHFK